jgi:AraC-like DNA-binding protein
MRSCGDSSGGPVIALANWFQFASGERAVRPCVESRMLLWCVTGAGKLRANGTHYPFGPGDWILLPWRHEIIYDADVQSPFFVGGIHIIPWHAGTEPVTFQVAHSRTDALANHCARRNESWPDMDKILTGHFAGERDRLSLLTAYVVERYQYAPPNRELMSSLAQLVIHELRITAASASANPQPGQPRPNTLRRVQEYVRTRLDRALSIRDLAEVAGCSPSSVHRQFHDFEGQSPGQWMARQRVERAAFLLRTTRLSVQEVGEQVGLTDPFHFSRYFKRQMGISPRAYQQSRQYI